MEEHREPTEKRQNVVKLPLVAKSNPVQTIKMTASTTFTFSKPEEPKPENVNTKSKKKRRRRKKKKKSVTPATSS